LPYTVLVVETDPASRSLLERIVAKCSYSCQCVGDGAAALKAAGEANPALMLLALKLPDMDGFDVCRKLRYSSSIPLIVVSSRKSEVDRICAFELGADDYVTKPFQPAELVWRIKALMRTTYQQHARGRIGPSLHFERITIQPAGREVSVDNCPIHLTPKEFELLLALAENHGKVVSSERLLLDIWGYDKSIRTRTLDVHINRLRSKIEADSANPQLIRTVNGVGYRFDDTAAIHSAAA
jgi:DNA-binding response OmpR family regulator